MFIFLSCGVLLSIAAHLGLSLSFLFHPVNLNVYHMNFNAVFDKGHFKYVHGLSNLWLLE